MKDKKIARFCDDWDRFADELIESITPSLDERVIAGFRSTASGIKHTVNALRNEAGIK